MDFLKRETTQCILIGLGLVLLSIFVQKSSLNFMKHASGEVLKPLATADSLQNEILEKAPVDSVPKLKTLKTQYQISEQFKTYYKNLAVSYYANYYAFSICSIIMTTLLTIAVFLVANRGWQNCSANLKTFLLLTVILSSIYYFLPNVLNNQENVAKNAEKVKAFQKIESDILLTFNRIDHLDDQRLDSALASNYNQILLNFDFITTIDNSKISSNPQDLLKGVKP